ncbi:MAG: sugar transferase [Gammaproteobacteria bacterium]|nr:sugar transferase [Pseudomonadales bacterium]
MSKLKRKGAFFLVKVLTTVISWILVIEISSALAYLHVRRPFPCIVKRRSGETKDPIMKLKTTVRNAAELLKRHNSFFENDIRFLNVPSNVPVFILIGHFIERVPLTEIPQLFHVLNGGVSLVGNQPMPEDVLNALSVLNSNVEETSYTPASLTGPTALAGRDKLSSIDRLSTEAAYRRIARKVRTWLPDFVNLFYTALISMRLRQSMSIIEVRAFLLNPGRPG